MSSSLEVLLLDLVRGAVREEVAAALAQGCGPMALLDKHGAAELLAMTPEAVETLSKRRKLPRVVLPNGRVRFERAELLRWAKGES